MIEAMETLGSDKSSYLLTDDSGFFIVEASDNQRVMRSACPGLMCVICRCKIMTDGETQEAARLAFAMIRDTQIQYHCSERVSQAGQHKEAAL